MGIYITMLLFLCLGLALYSYNKKRLQGMHTRSHKLEVQVALLAQLVQTSKGPEATLKQLHTWPGGLHIFVVDLQGRFWCNGFKPSLCPQPGRPHQPLLEHESGIASNPRPIQRMIDVAQTGGGLLDAAQGTTPFLPPVCYVKLSHLRVNHTSIPIVCGAGFTMS